ncbi:sugar ABC transporter ATP-binding protein [Pseudomonas gingeri]|uniref:sugar ABC transporter ATP-binding protein n=1 Tax=Pseudomonas gingeri TaxID=117681 RepID=UPI0015A23634|nr:sugar ABC transporter ATP-binding protein [Pseudomonas gingeri]NWA28663.1 sugar ABC transporter ATP-binding protein [Pseudomonas gingeri]
MSGVTVLLASGLTKKYGGVEALSQVGFDLFSGEIHGLCGENGAGKSTLIKILGGLVKPDSGSIIVHGKPLRLGVRVDPELISIVHQELSIVPHLSVLDNIMLNCPGGVLYWRGSLKARARNLLDIVGLEHVDSASLAQQLTLAEQQLVEIARGIASEAKVLLLDEPTATLSDVEIRKVFAVLRKLRDGGSTIVIVSHRLDEIFELTDRVTVFRNGRHVCTELTSALDGPALVKVMIGREVIRGAHHAKPALEARSETALCVRALAINGKCGPFNLSFAQGETVAVVGQLGSGADLLLEALAGLHQQMSGEIFMGASSLSLNSINDAYQAGIAYVPEDRAAKGVFLDESIEINITSQVLDRISVAGVMVREKAQRKALQLAQDFQIDARRLTLDVSTLSGGNQQKVALAKAIAMTPKVLLLNEPTRGVDIGARAEIYERLSGLTNAGMSIVFYSSDLEEVMEVADRVITVYRGQVVNDKPRWTITGDDVLHDILHGTDNLEACA